jgi:hypothetical protein
MCMRVLRQKSRDGSAAVATGLFRLRKAGEKAAWEPVGGALGSYGEWLEREMSHIIVRDLGSNSKSKLHRCGHSRSEVDIHQNAEVASLESVPCLDDPNPAVLGASFSVPVTSTLCPISLSTLLPTPVSANLAPFLPWTTTTLLWERSKHPRSVTPIEAFVAADCSLEGLFRQANKDPSKSSNTGRRTLVRPRFLSEVGTGTEQALKGLGRLDAPQLSN